MKLEIRNMTKTYPNGIQALKNVSLDIASGMFGLLGPNGAGKSTLMRTLATLQDPDAGEARFCGMSIHEKRQAIRCQLGYLPQEFGLYRHEKAEAMLDYIGILKGILDNHKRREQVDRLLQLTNLSSARKQKLGTFSGGMKRRFGIAQALLGDPSLLIADEPTAGLDPEERVRFYNILSSISEEKVVLLSTHIVHDVEALCPNMAIMDQGEIRMSGPVKGSIEALKGTIWSRTVRPEEVEQYTRKFQLISSNVSDGMATIRVKHHTRPDGFEAASPTLTDVYFIHISRPEIAGGTDV